MTLRVQILKDKFNQSLGLPFKELLPSSVIASALKNLKIKYKQRLFDPFVTVWAFLSQVLDADKSCHNAVSKIIAYLTGEGVEIFVQDNGIGLNEAFQEKIFGVFTRLVDEERFEGTGVGLAIARRIIEKHKGLGVVLRFRKHDKLQEQLAGDRQYYPGQLE